MPRMPNYIRREWAFFLDESGRKKYSLTCYVSNFNEGKIGKKYKDEIVLPNSIADSTVKVEIVGG